MGLKPPPELHIVGLFNHLGESQHDLILGIIDIAQHVHEQVAQVFDLFEKKPMASSLSWLQLFGRITERPHGNA
jgi:hypothetical protein